MKVVVDANLTFSALVPKTLCSAGDSKLRLGLEEKGFFHFYRHNPFNF